ncbi:MAG: flagellar hook-length control protein FliK [Lachnospiraceae bacterium]|nr:flagellar hook-length control protein FliK [Lachnospiraceae bacterium]
MEIITTAPAATAAKSGNLGAGSASSSYSKSVMASRALQSTGMTSEVNISNLEKGDVFKGEITNLTGKSVTVSLGNGQTLAATLMDNVTLNIGNNLYFEVKENTGEKIYLRPLTDEKFSPENQTIEKSLQSAGLQLNEKNMAVVKELMDAGMPIDRSSIMKVLQQSLNNPNASIKTIVSLIRADIPVNDVSVEQFEQYKAHASNLNSQMENLTNQITNMYESLSSSESFAGDVLRFNQGIIDTFTTTTPGFEDPLPTLTLEQAFYMDQGEIESFNNFKGPALDAAGQPILAANGQAYPEGAVVLDSNGNPVVNPDGSVQVTEEFVNQIMKEHPELTKEQVMAGIKSGELLPDTNSFKNEIQNAFANQLRSLGINEDAIKMMLDPKNSAEDLMKAVHDFISNNSNLTDDQIKNFFSSKEYSVIVQSVVDHHFKMTPEQMKDKQSVDALFTRVAEESEKLADLAKNFSGGESMSDEARNMNRNLQFMEMLNDKYTFAQIPLSLSNQDANSELYVYTNKKTLSKDKKAASILLHLDMDNLGSTDIHVQLNGGKVNARFYLEDGRSVNVVSNNIGQLEEQISKLGLSLDTEVVKRPADKKQEVEDFEEDFLAKDAPVTHQAIKRYTFDMRA